MAVLFRAAASAAFSAGGTVAPAKPTGFTSLDVALALVTLSTNALQPTTAPTTTAGTWTRIATRNRSAGFLTVELWQYVGGSASDPATWTWTLTGTTGTGNVIQLAYSGVDQTTPIDATPVTNTATAANATTVAYSTVTANALLIGTLSLGAGQSAVVPTSTDGTWVQDGFNNTQKTGMVDELLKASAGAVATVTWGNTSADYVTTLCALRPAAAVTAPFPPWPPFVNTLVRM